MSDILLSLDDKYLYFSNWLHGDVRQYDVSDPTNPKMTARVFLGGQLVNDPDLELVHCDDLKASSPSFQFKLKRFQMINEDDST